MVLNILVAFELFCPLFSVSNLVIVSFISSSDLNSSKGQMNRTACEYDGPLFFHKPSLQSLRSLVVHVG